MSSHRSPNILLITSDQHNPNAVGFLNEFYSTPSLDRLADEGVTMNRSYTACPLSTPARSTWITGQYPFAHGAWSNGTNLAEDAVSLPRLLSDAGYATGIIGTSHLQAAGQVQNLEGASRRYDTDYFRSWTGPWYGFGYAQINVGHTDEPHSASMHYRSWLEDRRVKIPRYFREESDEQEGAGEWKLPEKSHPSTWVGDRTLDFLKKHVEQKADDPFFLSVNFADPHSPYRVPKPWSGQFADLQVGRPKRRWREWEDKPEIYRAAVSGRVNELGWHHKAAIPAFLDAGRFVSEDSTDWYEKEEAERIRIYAGMVALLDHNIGRILDAVDEFGLYENTVVVFTSDHGDYLGEHFLWGTGPAHYDGCIRVPTIARWPGHVPPGTDSNALVSGVDLAPTLLDAAGLSPDAGMQGISQLSVFEHPDQRVRRGAYVDHRVEAGLYVNTWVTDQYRLSVHHRIDGENDIELYDLDHDPDEFVNLAPSGKHCDAVTVLMAQMTGERSYLTRNWQQRPTYT